MKYALIPFVFFPYTWDHQVCRTPLCIFVYTLAVGISTALSRGTSTPKVSRRRRHRSASYH